jgi:hypothetical protein
MTSADASRLRHRQGGFPTERELSSNRTSMIKQVFNDLKMYRRFAFGLPSYLRNRWTLDSAKAAIKGWEADRENNFLRVVEKGIFGHPGSPYLPMLNEAHCSFEDIRSGVANQGLEPTLLELRRAGVYVTFDEFKGRKPIVRGSLEIPVTASAFDNPFLRPHFVRTSGGSSGPGTRVPQDLDHLRVQSAYELVTYDAQGAVDVPALIWRGVLPDGSGIDNALRRSAYGHPPTRWFSNSNPWDLRPSMVKYTTAAWLTIVIARMSGTRIPSPRYNPLDRPETVATAIAELLERHGSCLVLVAASRGLRVCLAAKKLGLDFTGAIFRLGGEPMTAAKMAGIESTGARIFTTYGFSELGRVGMDCSRQREINDLHLCTGVCALVVHDTMLEGSEITVPAFNFTALQPTAPKILLNAESDDFGIVDKHDCGCPLHELGLTTRLRRVASYRKVTGEGVTLVGSEMIQVLEEVLPRKYGGSPLDYQLIEEEDARGLTRLTLAIDPAIQIGDEAEVIDTVLSSLGRSSVMADSAREIWRQAQTFRVRRQKPKWTGRGKLMSLHVESRYSGPEHSGQER